MIRKGRCKYSVPPILLLIRRVYHYNEDVQIRKYMVTYLIFARDMYLISCLA